MEARSGVWWGVGWVGKSPLTGRSWGYPAPPCILAVSCYKQPNRPMGTPDKPPSNRLIWPTFVQIANVDQLWSARDSPGVFPGPHASWGWSRGPIQVHRPAYMPIRACEPGLARPRSSFNLANVELLVNLLVTQCPCMVCVLSPTCRLPLFT